MRVLLIIKWVAFMAIMALFFLLAFPLLLVGFSTQHYATQQWLRGMGQDHARRCKLDFLKERKDYGIGWIVLAACLLFAVMYWGRGYVLF